MIRSAPLPSDLVYTDALELIHDTPLLELGRVGEEQPRALLFGKMENANPGGSVKDRIALAMIDAAEREGLLRPGGTVIEATSGNTGIGLAIAAAVKGYKCIFVMTDKASVEKSRYLKALGADVVITPVSAKPGTPDHYVSTAKRIVEILHKTHVVHASLLGFRVSAHLSSGGTISSG